MGQVSVPESRLQETLGHGHVTAQHSTSADSAGHFHQPSRSPERNASGGSDASPGLPVLVQRRHLRTPARREPSHVRPDVRGHAKHPPEPHQRLGTQQRKSTASVTAAIATCRRHCQRIRLILKYCLLSLHKNVYDILQYPPFRRITCFAYSAP